MCSIYRSAQPQDTVFFIPNTQSAQALDPERL
jgi:hypothetical protein